MTPLVQIQGITKSFPGILALRGVDLELRPGRIHALVGENGAGKSTLLNVLAGLLQPDGGTILLTGRPATLPDARAAWAAGIVTVHQEVDLFGDLSVMENVAWQHGLAGTVMGLINWRAERRCTREALATVGSPVSPDEPAGRLTPAQRQLVEIAGAVSRSARVLVLDEPTSSLSAAEAERLFDLLRRFRDRGTAVVYVSHRLEEIFALADDVTVLRDGRRVWTGPVADTDAPALIRHMVGREVTVTRKGHDRKPGLVRLACQGLTAADGSFHDVTLEARAGEVLGLYGLVGAGRSEWAQAVFGLRPVSRGTLHLDGRPVTPRSAGQMARQGIAYVPEDRLHQGLCRGLGVGVNAVLASLRQLAQFGWLSAKREARRAEAVTRQLDVRLASLQQPVGTLSGGNQQKVVVGRWLDRHPVVLLLDEPTRGVDVGAREEIYALLQRLADEGRAIVLISSDLPEVMSQSDRVGVFRGGQLVATCPTEQTTEEEVAALAFPAPTRPEKRRPEDTMDLVLRPRRSGLSPELGLGLFLAAFFVAVHRATGNFLQMDNLAGLAIDAALLGFCATGAMLVLLAGGLDISLGAIVCLAAGVAGSRWENGAPALSVLAAAVLVGGTAGALNAALSLVGRVHPIVVTLGTMSVYRGLTLWWLGQDVQVGIDRRAWAIADWLGVPVVAWMGLGLAVVTALALSFTADGRELYALGSNPRAAVRVGIRPWSVWLRAFTLQGMLAGLAGVLYLARSGSVQPTSHEDRTLEAIAAAVVGGVAITGGRGSVTGLVMGCLLLVSLGRACIYLRLSPYWQQSLVGAVLLAAILFDAFVRRRSA
jgi:ABC-type sugar transport system ATPase subunit/ribose/xylose/arabinose/galactoside ABC-type transport system permease subunit